MNHKATVLRSDEWILIAQQPRSCLRPFIAGDIFGYEEHKAASLGRIHLPGTIVPLIFTFCGGYEVGFDNGQEPALLASFSAGLVLRAAQSRSLGKVRSVQVNVPPLIARRIFRRPMSEIAGEVLPLCELIGRQVGEIEERLASADDWPERFEIVERFLCQRLADTEDAGDAGGLAALAWHRLAVSHGSTPIGQIAEELASSPKAFISLFRDATGLPPKAAARLLRFENALSMLERSGRRTGALVAAEAGYADQGHFIREFAEFTGSTPDAWLARVAQA